MGNFIRTLWLLVISFIVMGSSAPLCSETFLYLVYDGSRVGEKNQVLGVARSMKKYLPGNVKRVEFDVKDTDQFLASVATDVQPESKNIGIVLASEVRGIDVLKQLKPQKNLIIAHSAHQFTEDHKALRNLADIVALPRHVVTPEIRKSIESEQTQLIETSGVPHNLTRDDIDEAYRNSKVIFPMKEEYIGVILGGDAEDPNMKVRYYTKEEARQLAKYLSPLANTDRTHILILNGPRTGKHDPQTGKVIENSHRDGNIDEVTKAFVEELEGKGLKAGENFTLLDFQFGQPSAYLVVLGAIAHTNGSIFVAGESTSMVSETADCLRGPVQVYTNNAMNENHTKHCESEHAVGRIFIIENKDGQWQAMKSRNRDPEASKSASETIAKAIQLRHSAKQKM